jgi:hypothetical protein
LNRSKGKIPTTFTRSIACLTEWEISRADVFCIATDSLYITPTMTAFCRRISRIGAIGRIEFKRRFMKRAVNGEREHWQQSVKQLIKE